MSSNSLMKAAYNLVTAMDRAADGTVHEEVAKIVKLHAKINSASAWIPIPLADLAALTANTWTMYARINKAVDIQFSKSILKSLAAGIGTNLLSNLPLIALGSVLKGIPALGTFSGGLIMSAYIYPVTIASGILYMKALAILLKQSSVITEVNLKGAVDSIMKDKDAIKQILEESKKEYQAAKASGELEEKELKKLQKNRLIKKHDAHISTPPTGKIEEIKVNFDTVIDHARGMIIHVRFTVQNLKDIECLAVAYFFFKNGHALIDSNNRYCTYEGKVCVAQDFNPRDANSVFEDFQLFIPYDELHITANGISNLQFIIKIHEKSTLNLITSSDYFDFEYRIG